MCAAGQSVYSVSEYYTRPDGFPWAEALAFASAHAACPSLVSVRFERNGIHKPFVSAWPGAEKLKLLFAWTAWRRMLQARKSRSEVVEWTPRWGLTCLAAAALRRECVHFGGVERIDCGAVYDDAVVKLQKKERERLQIEGEELPSCKGRLLAIDVDVDDYENVGANKHDLSSCDAAWPLLALAVKVLAEQLEADFGFSKDEMLVVYSGRRGVHLVVASKRAFEMSSAARKAVAHSLSKGDGLLLHKATAKLGFADAMDAEHCGYVGEKAECEKRVALLKRAWRKFGLPSKSRGGLGLMDDSAGRSQVMSRCGLTQESLLWHDVLAQATGEDAYELLSLELQSTPGHAVHYARRRLFQAVCEQLWPRIDFAVAKDITHTLKIPFSAQPATRRLCLPLEGGVDCVDTFHPSRCATVDGLLDKRARDVCLFQAGLRSMRLVLGRIAAGNGRSRAATDAQSGGVGSGSLSGWRVAVGMARVLSLKREEGGVASLYEAFERPVNEGERRLVHILPPGCAVGEVEERRFYHPDPFLDENAVGKAVKALAKDATLTATQVGKAISFFETQAVGAGEDEALEAAQIKAEEGACRLCATPARRRAGVPMLQIDLQPYPADIDRANAALASELRACRRHGFSRSMQQRGEETQQTANEVFNWALGRAPGPAPLQGGSDPDDTLEEGMRRQIQALLQPGDAARATQQGCTRDDETASGARPAAEASAARQRKEAEAPNCPLAAILRFLPQREELPPKPAPRSDAKRKVAEGVPCGAFPSKKARPRITKNGKTAVYLLGGLEATDVWSELERLVVASSAGAKLQDAAFVKRCHLELDKFFLGPAARASLPSRRDSLWRPERGLPDVVEFEEYQDSGGRLGYERRSEPGGEPTGWRGVKGMLKEVRGAIFQKYWHVDLSKCHTVMLLGSGRAAAGLSVDCQSIEAALAAILAEIEAAQAQNRDSRSSYSKEQAALPPKVLLSSILNKDKDSDPLLSEGGGWSRVARQHSMLEAGAEAAWKHPLITDEQRSHRPKDKTWMSGAARLLEAQAVAAMWEAIAEFEPLDATRHKLVPSISINDEVLFFVPGEMGKEDVQRLGDSLQASLCSRLGFEPPFKIAKVRQ